MEALLCSEEMALMNTADRMICGLFIEAGTLFLERWFRYDNVLNVFFLNAVIKKNKKRKRHKSKSSDRSHKIYAKEAKFILMATHHRRKWRKCLSACVFFFFFFHVCEISL